MEAVDRACGLALVLMALLASACGSGGSEVQGVRPVEDNFDADPPVITESGSGSVIGQPVTVSSLEVTVVGDGEVSISVSGTVPSSCHRPSIGFEEPDERGELVGTAESWLDRACASDGSPSPFAVTIDIRGIGPGRYVARLDTLDAAFVVVDPRPVVQMPAPAGEKFAVPLPILGADVWLIGGWPAPIRVVRTAETGDISHELWVQDERFIGTVETGHRIVCRDLDGDGNVELVDLFYAFEGQLRDTYRETLIFEGSTLSDATRPVDGTSVPPEINEYCGEPVGPFTRVAMMQLGAVLSAAGFTDIGGDHAIDPTWEGGASWQGVEFWPLSIYQGDFRPKPTSSAETVECAIGVLQVSRDLPAEARANLLRLAGCRDQPETGPGSPECPALPELPTNAVEIARVELDGNDSAEEILYQVAMANGMGLVGLVGGFVTTPNAVTTERVGMGLHASMDLDADGFAELFLHGFGNTARLSLLVSYDGCTINAVFDSSSPGETFMALTGVGGNSCVPTGCLPRVRCLDTEDGVLLETSLMQPDPVLSFDERIELIEADAVPVAITTTLWRYNGNAIELISETTVMSTTRSLPPDAPTGSDSDKIDC